MSAAAPEVLLAGKESAASPPSDYQRCSDG